MADTQLILPTAIVEELKLLHTEAKRYELLLKLIRGRIYTVIHQETGIDTQTANCELDLDRGVLQCEDKE